MFRLRETARGCIAIVMLSAPAAVLARVTPAAGYTPADDTPSIKIG